MIGAIFVACIPALLGSAAVLFFCYLNSDGRFRQKAPLAVILIGYPVCLFILIQACATLWILGTQPDPVGPLSGTLAILSISGVFGFNQIRHLRGCRETNGAQPKVPAVPEDKQ